MAGTDGSTARPVDEHALIPRYVRVTRRAAETAGVTAKYFLHEEKEQDGSLSCTIVTSLIGTWPQLLQTRLIPPGSRAPKRRIVIHGGYLRRVSAFKIEEDTFRIDIDDTMPVSICAHQNTVIEVIRYPQEIAYHGTREELLREGILTEKQLPVVSTRKVFACKWSSDQAEREWRTWLIVDGSILFFEETSEAAKERLAKKSGGKEERKYSLDNIDEYRERGEDWVVRFARDIPRIYGTVETKRGLRYTMDPKALAAVINAIEVVAQRLRDIPVKVEKLVSEEEKALACQRATNASIDAAFQRFLAQLPKSGHVIAP